MGQRVDKLHGESNKLKAQPPPEMILSQQQENIYEEDSDQESCSWARTVGNRPSPLGWVSLKQETRLKSDWPMETMLEKQERSKKAEGNCRNLR